MSIDGPLMLMVRPTTSIRFALRKLRSIQNRVLMSHLAVPRKVAPPAGGN
jgi:hypothetical protein